MDEACLHAPTRKTSKPHGSVKEKKRRAIHCTPVWPLAELRLGVRIPSEPTAALLAINIRAHVHAHVYTHRQKKQNLKKIKKRSKVTQPGNAEAELLLHILGHLHYYSYYFDLTRNISSMHASFSPLVLCLVFSKCSGNIGKEGEGTNQNHYPLSAVLIFRK